MKSITGRVAPKENVQFFGSGDGQRRFNPQSLLWRISLPGAAGTAALRGLMRQAAEQLGEEDFPYTRAADVLLEQQMVIFSGWQRAGAKQRITGRRWGQAVWLDLLIREQLPQPRGLSAGSGEMLYQEYLKFAEVLGIRAAQLPRSLGAFNAWARASFAGWGMRGYNKLARGCVTELLPLCWPVNIAVILYLLPGEFWGAYGRELGKESARLAACVERIFTELSSSRL